MKYISFRMALSILVISGIIGCNNNKNGDNIIASGANTAVVSTATYLFYKNPLTAVDPDNPANQVPIVALGTNIGNIITVNHGNFNGADHTVSDRHYRTIIYKKSADGTLWKVSTLESGTLTPAQLSNEAGAGTICSTKTAADYANHNNAQVIYRLPGANGKCNNINVANDDIWKMVKVGMSAADNPIGAYHPLSAVHHPQTGALNGWLVKDAGNLVFYDADLNAGSAVVLSAVTTSVSHTMTGPQGHVFLYLNDELRVFDPGVTPATLSSSRHSYAGFNGSRFRDDTNLYFTDGLSLYKVPLDGSATSSLVITEASGTLWLNLVTADRIIYSNNNNVKSIPKTGGAATTLFSDAGGVQYVGWSGNRIYYNTFYFNKGWHWTAHLINDDGSGGIQRMDDAWFGWTEPMKTSFGATRRNIPIHRVLVKKDASAPFSLSSYDAATYAHVADMGVMPAEMQQAYDPLFMRLPSNNGILGRAYSSVTTSWDSFFLNTEQDNSLVRLTATNTLGEIPMGAVGCSLQTNAEVDITLLLILLAGIGYIFRCRRLPF